MKQSPIWVASYATTSETQELPAKFTTLDVLVANVTTHPSLDFALNITEAIRVYTASETKVLLNVTRSRKNICAI